MSPVRRPRRLVAALALPVVLVATGGCAKGGGGPSQEEYAAAADAVCKASDEKLDELYMDQSVDQVIAAGTGESGVYTDRPERWVRAKIVTEYTKLSNGLKGIPPPDGDAAYLTDLYADLDTRIEILEQTPSMGRAAVEADTQMRDRFESYGMDECPPPPDEQPAWEDPVKVAEAVEERLAEEAGGADDETTTTTAAGAATAGAGVEG